MNSSLKQTRVEWTFLAAMIALCAILTGLQYRWTGEVARAELAQLRAHLAEPGQRLCRAFDTELTESCARLLPTASEVDSLGREGAHIERFRQWASAKPRPIFGRMAVAIRAGSALQLHTLNQKTAQFAPMEWPPEWSGLRENLTRRISTPGGPRYLSPTGTLLSFAVFGGPRAGGGANIGWMILELDPAYLREVWLPELVRTHLNADDHSTSNVAVRTASSPDTLIYSSTGNPDGKGEPQVALRFNRSGRNADDAGGPGESDRWILEIRQAPGALEAIVSASRRRNLTVAIFLNALMLVAGCLLVRYTHRSRQLAEAQMNFVANVSHELRTPLTVIRGAAHNLQRGVVQDPERIGQYSGLIIQHAEQLTNMVEQVLEFAGARKNQPAIPREPVSLAEVLHDAVAAAAADTGAAHCEVALEIAPSLPAVKGDAAALRRVFQNLIANAAKHGGAGGWIGVTASNGGTPPMIEVKVADHGPGIAEEEQAEIFTPFFRGARAQAAQTPGSGLGLSLVREIVEAHNGRVSVRSEAGLGASFTVSLPAIGQTK